MGKVYTTDEGTAIELDVGEDISAATTLQIKAQDPTGAVDTWTATLVGTSVLRYVASAGAFDPAGVWFLQARVVTPDGVWLGETVKLRIYEAYE
jgi:hypothetical protein